MTEYVLQSIFAEDMSQYLDQLKQDMCCLGRWRRAQSALRSLDRHCASVCHKQKALTSELVSSWQESLDLSPSTKSGYRTLSRGFSKHLVSRGIGDRCIDRYAQPHYHYSSALGEEIQAYLALRGKNGKVIHDVQSALRSLDKYLTSVGLNEKRISRHVMENWYASRQVSAVVKQSNLCIYRAFSKYLLAQGISAYCPEACRRVAPPYVFSGPVSKEINDYLRLLTEAGREIHALRSALRSLDRYLVSVGHEARLLPEQVVLDWQKTLAVSAVTKGNYISSVKGLATYLASLGIRAETPERPRAQSHDIPHTFSSDELSRIFDAADNFKCVKRMVRSALVFPILLRILYGCGLRIEECCALRWNDIDLERGIITIYKAKNRKQRHVPMDPTLTETLRSYQAYTSREEMCCDFLFESEKCPGQYLRQNTFYEWFRKILEAVGIDRTKVNPHHRGICPNCLRHTFTLTSFLKGEESGTPFEDYAPFLAAYLGHESPKETEAYLRSHYSVYTRSHQRVSASISHVFPEVSFEEV